MVTSGGFLRLAKFYRQLLGTISSEVDSRSENELPIVISPEVNLQYIGLSVILAIVLFAARYQLEIYILGIGRGKFSLRTRRRLSENLFYTIYYTLAFTYFISILRPSVDWSVNLFTNKNEIVPQVCYPYPPPMNTAEHFYYIQGFGFYLSAIVFLIALDPRRSDFREIFLHHIVTLGLVIFSYLVGYVRIGMIVIALHDVGDIFLYGAKFVHYLGFSGLDTALFAVFAVTFYVTRLVMYSRVVYAIGVETLMLVAKDPTVCSWGRFFETYFFHHLIFTAFLVTLLGLHCFWFALILRMIYREVFLGKKVSDEGDIRSDDEDEDEEEDSSLNNGKSQ